MRRPVVVVQGDALNADRPAITALGPLTSNLQWASAPGTFEPLKRLKLVQSLWMGVERLLADPAFPKGVPLARLVVRLVSRLVPRRERAAL